MGGGGDDSGRAGGLSGWATRGGGSFGAGPDPDAAGRFPGLDGSAGRIGTTMIAGRGQVGAAALARPSTRPCRYELVAPSIRARSLMRRVSRVGLAGRQRQEGGGPGRAHVIGRAWVSWASIGLSPTTAALKRTCNCCQRRPPIPGPPDRSLPDGGFRRPCRLGLARAWRQMERLSAFWPRSLPGRSVPRAYQQQTMGTPNDSQLGNVPVGILSAPSFALVLLAVRRVDAGGARCILASLG